MLFRSAAAKPPLCDPDQKAVALPPHSWTYHLHMRIASLLLALLAATSASASCIHGYLKTSDGQPVAGATITISAEQKTIAEGTSDGRGWFRVDPKRRGEFDVSIVAPGYAPVALRAPAGKNLGTITLAASPLPSSALFRRQDLEARRPPAGENRFDEFVRQSLATHFVRERVMVVRDRNEFDFHVIV